MAKQDILEFLFDRKMDEDNFHFNKKGELRNYRKNISNTSEILYNCIDSKVQPNVRNELKKLIDKNVTAIADCNYKEFQLFYKDGVIDGIQLVLSAIF